MAYVPVASVMPGEAAEVMASGDGETTVELVELTGPEDARVLSTQRVDLEPQPLRCGSYLRSSGLLPAVEGFTLSLQVQPWRTDREQGLAAVARGGEIVVALSIGADGHAAARAGRTLLRAERPLVVGRWAFLALGYDAASGRLALTVDDRSWEGRAQIEVAGGRLLFGALHDIRDDPWAEAISLDGRLAELDLRLAAGSGAPRWDLWPRVGADDRVRDRSTADPPFDLEIVNGPQRAVAGPAWRGAQSHLDAPAEFAALHLHHDDLEDAGWRPSTLVHVPSSATSGLYAARLRGPDGQCAWAPFVVRPRLRRRLAVLLPTYTYLAYANQRQSAEAAFFGDYRHVTDRVVTVGPIDELIEALPEVGLSLYEDHADGSPTVLASRLRPLLNVRPDYRWWMTGAPRHLGADLHLLRWLRDQGHAFDVLADEDLDGDGVSTLAGYRAVVTGSHPEYVTERMLDTLEDYLDGGGSLLYLGGNGFYWVTGTQSSRPHRIEVRRASVGAPQHWDTPAWESRLQTTGELGGLWRLRGRPPQRLCGLGFAAQGWGPGQAYVRQPDSRRPEVADLFRGIADDELIGDFGLSLGGAAGDEIDRADPRLGTPRDALVLATSAGRHSEHYQPPPEDGDADAVGADLVFRQHPGGGLVFSAGSMNWVLSLGHRGGRNNVSRLTANVLARALSAPHRDGP